VGRIVDDTKERICPLKLRAARTIRYGRLGRVSRSVWDAGISGLAGAHLPESWQRGAMIVFGVTALHEKPYMHFPSGEATGQ
jgi:hypothetical protein